MTIPPEMTHDRAVAEELRPWSRLVRGRKFVWLLSPTWDNVWTRQNHFVTRLARLGGEVLYVENPPSWTSSCRQKRWRELPMSGMASVREIEPGLRVMKPALSLPGSKGSDFIARINAFLLASQIRRWTDSHGWRQPLVWCRLPHSLFAMERLQPAVTVYDVTDDYEAYESNPSVRRLAKMRQGKLLSCADLVFVTAQPLQATVAPAASHWVPNGVEYELFAEASKPGQVHALVASMRKPVLGFVGLTSYWMDFELLAMLGQRWPNQILMLGPIAAQIEKRARSIPGIVWGGFVPQQNLPPYLRGFDVCMMPYLVNERTRKSSPLKMWEYVATGKAFVSVDLPALDPIRQFIDVARDRDHFVQLVERRLKMGVTAPNPSATGLAKSHSWNAIFQQMMSHLGPKLVSNN